MSLQRANRLATDDVVLLLTASIRVHPGIPGVSAPDPAARLRDYAENLRFAINLSQGPRRIVLAENTAADLSAFEREAAVARALGKRLELVSLDGNDFPGEFGKGFGELNLLERTAACSQLMAETAVWVKLTGRQRVLNLPALLGDLPADVEFAGDFRDTSLYRRLGLAQRIASGYCDTRLLVFSRTFFLSRLQGLSSGHALGGFSLEDHVYSMVTALPPSPRIVRRWAREPAFRGLAGHWGKDYGSPRERLKRATRAVCRRLLPWLWI